MGKWLVSFEFRKRVVIFAHKSILFIPMKSKCLGVSLLLILHSFLIGSALFAQERIDFTFRVGGAACDDAQYWKITPSSVNGTLQCDTWSSRGGKDGSDMTVPFMEYWTNAQQTYLSSLDDAQIRHIPIRGLPSGRYVVSMKVRCYAEYPSAGEQYVYFDTHLYANGKSTPIVSGAGFMPNEDFTVGRYGDSPTQILGYATQELECEVGEDGILNFGLDVKKKDYQNWVAWKDVKLYYLGGERLSSGTYYIRNKKSGKYINGGGYWGTQGVLKKHPMAVTFKKITDGVFVLSSGFENPSNGYNQWGLDDDKKLFLELGHSDSDKWYIIPTSQAGCYTIQTSDKSYLYEDGAEKVAVADIDKNSEEAQWEIISHNMMVNDLLIPSSNEKDATFFINDPDFDRNKNHTWQGGFTKGGYAEEKSVNGNYAAEVWNANFHVYQEITNIPNGRYRLSIQGYYRYNNTNESSNSAAVEAHKNGTELLLAEFYGNLESKPIQSVVDYLEERDAINVSTNALAKAAYAFYLGYYDDNSLEVEVTDHKLIVGVRKTMLIGCDWTVFDNFRLTLLELGDNTNYCPVEQPEHPDVFFEGATWDNPIDVTSLIINADCSSAKGWEGGPVVNGSPNKNAEKFNTTFDVYQEIVGIPNGWYRLKAQGMYRYGIYSYNQSDGNGVMAMLTIPYSIISRKIGVDRRLAVLYGNEVEVGLPSPFDYTHDPNKYKGYDGFKETELGWVPNTQSALSVSFSAGEYPVELLVPVTNGALRVGVKKPKFGYKEDWAAWDNFQLFYLGTDSIVLADEVVIENNENLQMCVGDRYAIKTRIVPENAVNKVVEYYSEDYGVAMVDENGIVTATGAGSTNIVAYNPATNNSASIYIEVLDAQQEPSAANLTINEIQVSNLDMFLDPSYNYSGYIELYHRQGVPVNLHESLWISDDATDLFKFRVVCDREAVGGVSDYALIWDYQYEDLLDMDGGTIYLSDNSGNIISEITYPAAVSRTSYARTKDGGDTWATTAYPTPNVSNEISKEYVDAKSYERLPMPEVNESSKVFSNPFSVMVEIPEGATLYYTLDGSTPTENHGAISDDGIFEINQTTLLRLRFYEEGMLPSPIRTLSYIYNDKGYMLPVLSVVSDPDNFYNDTIGVFVPGTNGIDGSGISFPCNWNQEWERPVAYNYISAEGEELHSQEASLKRFGGWSRSWYPFNFKLKAQAVFENQKYMTYPFFENKPHLRHKVIQVRNGGNDLLCRIKDASLQYMIISSGFYLDCQDYQSVHSFINGHYQGMLNLREPSNKHYALANYGIDTDEVDQMELNTGVHVNAGTSDAFWKWYDLSENAYDEKIYEEIEKIVDVDEFINYMAVQIFLGGDDWPQNNCKGFKGHDGRFHIVLFDIDQALRYDKGSFDRLSSNCPLVAIFFNMLGNSDFRKQFIDTYCIVGGSIFEPQRCEEIINRIADEMRPALALEGLSPDDTAERMKNAMTDARRNEMMNALRNWWRASIYEEGLNVEFSCELPAGKLLMNGIEVPTGKFRGTLFPPAKLVAVAPEGYRFKGWKNKSGNIVSNDSLYMFVRNGESNVVATFERMNTEADLMKAIATPIKVNEVSAGNDIYVNEYFKQNDWLELYNTTDTELDAAGLYISDDIDNPLKYQIKSGSVYNTKIPANGHLIVWADELVSHSLIHANFKLKNKDGGMVVVTSSDDFIANNAEFYSTHSEELKSFVDGITYTEHRGDRSIGRYPDGGKTFYMMEHPTIERSNVILTSDMVIGSDVCLMEENDGFSLHLSEGWNWISHNIENPISVSSLSTNATRIVGFKEEAYNDEKLGMVGNLGLLEAGDMYKVQMRASDTYKSTGLKCNSSKPIKLKPGWNWVGYTANGAQTLSTALRNTQIEEGDVIIGQDGFSTFTDGRWQGSLSTIETGKGYLYKSENAKMLHFAAPEVSVNYSAARSRFRSRQGGRSSKFAYPNVMGVIAVVEKDGEQIPNEQFTISAYSNGECRGWSEWIDGTLYMTIYGVGGEDIEYRAIDNISNVEYRIVETSMFTSDIVGSPLSPVCLTISEENGDVTSIEVYDKAMSEMNASTCGYYSLSGVLISKDGIGLPAGTYIVVFENGFRKKMIEK